MVKRSGLLAVAFLLAIASTVSAQGRLVTGKVVTQAGDGIAGVNVSITGTTLQTLTKTDGLYAITVPGGAATLVFRRIGYKRKEVALTADQTTADVTLEEDVFNLEAVVVTGQQTGISRRNAASATTVVTNADVTGVPAPAVDRALQGKVPGAIIQQNSGAPGGGTQIQIRGSSTVVGANTPLVVVDGVIMSNASISSGLFTVTESGNPQSTRNDGEAQDDPVNRLTDINPNDIESIEVLRGAAATSIYGSKGVNGVIVIKTNRGQPGKAHASVTQRLGYSELLRGYGTRSFDLPTAYAVFGDTALVNSYVVNGSLPTYDHMQEIAGEKPLSYETQLDVSGGTDNSRYFISGNVTGDGGIIANTGAQRQTFRVNLDQTFSPKLSLQLSSAFNHTTTQRGFTNNDNVGASVTYAIAYIPGFVPIQPVNGIYPSPAISLGGANPLQNIALGKNDEIATRFIGGGTLTYQVMEDAKQNLKLIGSAGMDFFGQQNKVLAPPELYFEASQALPGVSTLGQANSRYLNANLNMVHTFTPASQSFRATTSLGIQWEDRQVDRSRITGRGLLPGQENPNQGASQSVFEELVHERTGAFYGQEEWLGLNEHLLLTAGVRGERSSANGDVNKYFYYPKVLGSYNFPNVLGQDSWIKLRAAYGETGNQPQFGQKYTTLAGGTTIGGSIGTTVGQTAGDPNIKPERTGEIEAGVDANFWRGRGSIEVTVYRRTTNDVLIPVTPAPSTGYTLEFINGGTFRNEGVEIGLGLTPVHTPTFDLLFRSTFTSLKNTVVSLNLPGGATGFRPGNAGYGLAYGEFYVQVGRPITQIIGTDSLGNILQLGQANPDFRWSFSLEPTWKRFSASVLLDWQQGGVAQNQTLSLYDCNNLAPDGNTAAGQGRYESCNTGDARAFVQSTTFLKLREVSLGYELPEQWAGWFGAHNARVTVTGRNLAIWTNYTGYDPEVSNYGSQSITRNIDLGPYPPSRQIMFSIQAGF